MQGLGALIVCALVLSACGGSGSGTSGNAANGTSAASAGSGPSASAYAKTVCQAFAPLVHEEQRSGQALKSSTNITSAKLALKNVLHTMAGDAGTFATALRNAGVPAVKNGAQIASALQRLYGALPAIFERASRSASSLPTASASQFSTHAAAVVENMQRDIQAVTPSVKSPELDRAFKAQRACSGLGVPG